MQIKYWKNLQPPIDGMQKISALCWAPNSKRMAVSTADRVVHLFDEAGERRDKFSTRPADKDNKSYIVRAMHFSPDNNKLAIAQSDNIIFIYKIGTEWKDRKSICNKFTQSSSVTCMSWPSSRHGELYFGLAEGKVKVGVLKTNKSQTIYSTDSFVVAIASSPDCNSIVSGHLDNSIHTYNIETKQRSKIMHSTIPYALAWGAHILAGGNDGKVAFYESSGDRFSTFDYSKEDKVKEFTCAAFNLTGETAVVGNFNRFYVYNYNHKRPCWDQICDKVIENYYSVTAVAWKSDGSKIGLGSLCGSVDVFDVCIKKSTKGKFEFTYVSLSQLIVKRVDTGASIVCKSNSGQEITKKNIYQDRFLVASTATSLIVGDMDTCKVSEIPWRGSGNEKYDFSNPGVCMVFNAGELSIVEYGNNDLVGTCRTDNVHPNMISARLKEADPNNPSSEATKVIAYMLDTHTLSIQDLRTNQILATINHDSKVDYLELNPGGTKLLFRDKRRQLHLYNLKESKKTTLLNYCKYVNWVPGSDVVVAQNRTNICVWYSIDEPDKVTMHAVKGDVESIERSGNKTEVMVDDGQGLFSYSLDEALIEFGAALQYKGLDHAVEILEPLELTPETEANWKTLAKLAHEQQNFYVAERCYAALGNMAKADYLRKVNKLIAAEGADSYRVKAKIAVLEKQFHTAEALLLQHDEIEEAMTMYQELHRWDESIKIAEAKNHPNVRDFKENYYEWLLDTNQEAKAAEVKEREGDYQTSITLYLKGNLPAKAANIVTNYNVGVPQDQLDRISQALTAANMHEKAGEFYEKLNMFDRALDSYVRGHSFRNAIELAKRHFPQQVINLEEEWGNWLVSQKQLDLAIEHYVQARIFPKAVEAAIASRKWNRAIQLVQDQPAEIARPYYKQIAKHYAEIRHYDLAEKYFCLAAEYVLAFEMYVRSNKWDQAYQIITRYLPESEYTQLYIDEARKFEAEGRFKDAERMYLTANEPDLAINMYKKAEQFDNMIRLVHKCRPDVLKETHQHLGQTMEMKGNLKQAEHHYIESGVWQYAVDMFKAHEQWEECLRVAKANGNKKQVGEVAIKIAEDMGQAKGTDWLIKNGLIEAAIDFEANQDNFDQAFSLAENHARYKLPEIHLKYALHLEDEGRFKEAEEYFIKAGKPVEAVHMWMHRQDHHSALSIARQYLPGEEVEKIYLEQAKFFKERGKHGEAEQCYLNAKKPREAIHMYMKLAMQKDALRVAMKHSPDMIDEIQSGNIGGGGAGGEAGSDIVESAQLFERQGNFSRAIDRYLEITENHFDQADRLVEAWDSAFSLAWRNQKDRVQEVVSIVTQRLCQIQKFHVAAEMFEQVGDYEKAIDLFIQSKQFERATACAQNVRPSDLQDKFMRLINEKRHGDAALSGDIGRMDPQQALKTLADAGRWDECLTLAEKQGTDALNRYLQRYSQTYLKQGQFREVGRALTRFNCPAVSELLPVYKTIAVEVLAQHSDVELQTLRETLQKLCENLELQVDPNSPIYQEFHRYLLIAHLLSQKQEAKKAGLKQIHYKLAVSLLRYTAEIRVDQAFYEAGMAAREIGNDHMAFVLLNRYLDLYDAIEDPDSASLDNALFEGTDIPSPYDVPLPEKNFLNMDQKDEVGDWVLQKNMDIGSQAALSTCSCENCGNMLYEANLTCRSCRCRWEPCIASGYPLLRSQAVSCQTCNRGAIREHWNEFIAVNMVCPWCKSHQSAI